MSLRIRTNITALAPTVSVSWVTSPTGRVPCVTPLGHRSDRYQTNGTNRYGTFSTYSL